MLKIENAKFSEAPSDVKILGINDTDISIYRDLEIMKIINFICQKDRK